MLYDFILQHQGIMRESINGAGMILCGILSIMIVSFMFNSWYTSKTNADWSHMPGVPTACALLWIFTTESYRCAAVWTIYRFSPPKGGVGLFAAADFWPSMGYLLAGFGLVIGLLRCIYLFTPKPVRDHVWRLAAVSTALFITASILTR